MLDSQRVADSPVSNGAGTNATSASAVCMMTKSPNRLRVVPVRISHPDVSKTIPAYALLNDKITLYAKCHEEDGIVGIKEVS